MSIHYLVVEDGRAHFQLKVTSAEDHVFEFELLEISAWEMDEENTPFINEGSEPTAGFIKWDGCSNILFEQGSYTHFCGIDDVRRFYQALTEIYALAYAHFCSSSPNSYASENEDDFIARCGKGADL